MSRRDASTPLDLGTTVLQGMAFASGVALFGGIAAVVGRAFARRRPVVECVAIDLDDPDDVEAAMAQLELHRRELTGEE